MARQGSAEGEVWVPEPHCPLLVPGSRPQGTQNDTQVPRGPGVGIVSRKTGDTLWQLTCSDSKGHLLLLRKLPGSAVCARCPPNLGSDPRTTPPTRCSTYFAKIPRVWPSRQHVPPSVFPLAAPVEPRPTKCCLALDVFIFWCFVLVESVAPRTGPEQLYVTFH